MIGTYLASHATVIYDRWSNEDFCFSQSHCDNCHFELSLLDEIPLISYLFLKGRCRFCNLSIPSYLFLFELIGGFAFCKINFNSSQGIINATFLFSLLLVAIADYHQNEFDIIFIFPALTISLINNQFSNFTIVDYFSLLLIILIFSWNIFKQKIGLGDLIIYIIISTYMTPTIANLTFLFASLLLLFIFLIENNSYNHHYPFIPYIFLGLIFTQFLN